MLDDIREGVRDGVLVYHLDRLMRQPIELEQFVQVLTVANVQVRFVAGADVDIANGDGLKVLRMMGAVAANESASKSRRVRRKMVENAVAGRPHGGSRRPFGFEDDRVTIRADEAEVIRILASRYLAGESWRSLATWLDDQGIRTVFDKPWRTTTLSVMLSSARVAGLREHNGEIVGKAAWEPIISAADRGRLLALMEQKRSTRERTPRSYLLSGMARCGKCGGTLFTARRATSRRYVCMGGPDHRGCGRLTVVAGPLDELVTEAVLYRLDTPELAAALSGRAAQDEQTAAVADAIAADRAQLDELAGLYASKEIAAREWMAARKPIEARVKDAERRLARVTRNDALTGIVGNGTALRKQWSELNLTRQYAIVKAILDHVVIAPGTSGARELGPARVDLVWRL